MEAPMGRSTLMLMISGMMLILLAVAGLTIPVFTVEPIRDGAGTGDTRVRTQPNGDALDLGIILIGGGSYRRQ
jgi:hypothetical protein